MTLLDANVLVGLESPTDERYTIARRAIDIYEAKNIPMVTIPQVIYEFWVIATKPIAEKNGGLGMTTQLARESIERFFEYTHLLARLVPILVFLVVAWCF